MGVVGVPRVEWDVKSRCRSTGKIFSSSFSGGFESIYTFNMMMPSSVRESEFYTSQFKMYLIMVLLPISFFGSCCEMTCMKLIFSKSCCIFIYDWLSLTSSRGENSKYFYLKVPCAIDWRSSWQWCSNYNSYA